MRWYVWLVMAIMLAAIAAPRSAVTQEPLERPESAPVGCLFAFAGDEQDVPARNKLWMLCDGRSLAVRDYPLLFRRIGWAYGLGSDPVGRSTFRVPDLRGVFLRGLDRDAQGETTRRDRDATDRQPHRSGLQSEDSTGNEGNRVGSCQTFATANPGFIVEPSGEHQHTYAGATKPGGDLDEGYSQYGAYGTHRQTQKLDGNGKHSHKITGGDSETRPVNVAVNWIIRVR